MMRTGNVLIVASGTVIDPSTGQPTGQITIDVGEQISFNESNATDHGTYWIINSGARVIYPAQSGQIVDTSMPVQVGGVSSDEPDATAR